MNSDEQVEVSTQRHARLQAQCGDFMRQPSCTTAWDADRTVEVQLASPHFRPKNISN